MQNNGSMNRVYRLVWNSATCVWQAVSECSKGSGKSKTGKPKATARDSFAVAAFLLLPLAAFGADLPTGGQIVAGTGAINQSGGTMTVTQTSGKLAADWQSFSIGSGHTVNFVQPSTSSVALNRVLGADVSVIQGALNANGQVFLVNPNGVLFTSTAQVNVGALVASTLQLSADDFMADNYRFSGYSTAGVKNEGNIRVGSGGYVALIAARIDNTGSITAPESNVLMGAGSAVRLDMGGPVKIEVEVGALNTLIVQGGAIRADGGLVYLTAKAAGDLASSAINHTGMTEARTLSTGKKGEILLLGDMQIGATEVGGTMDVSAPNGGAGGFIETSAQHVRVGDDTQIKAGLWLIDPVDFTIGSGVGTQTSSGMGASTLASALGAGNVTIQTDAGSGGNGDIFVNSAVTWNSSSKLTLSAHRNIAINADITAQTPGGQLQLEYGQDAAAAGNTATYSFGGGKINLPEGDNFFTKLGNDVVPVTTWKVINSLGTAGSTSGFDLQGINGALSGNYVLGGDIDASATSTWNSGAGFEPIGTNAARFTGQFDGLGHAIGNLTIIRPSTDSVGLIGSTFNAIIRNVGLVGADVTGQNAVGALIGEAVLGELHSSFATGGQVNGTNQVGGLVGYNNTMITSNSFTSNDVFGSNQVGGLVGETNGGIASTYNFSTGGVTGTGSNVGGLIGLNGFAFLVNNSYATGTVSGDSRVGGLVGQNYEGTISISYATGSTYGGTYAGGLVGLNTSGGTIQNSYSSGSLRGGNRLGGLVGVNEGAVTDSYSLVSITDVAAQDLFGGLVGHNNGGSITRSYATGVVDVQVPTNNAGSLVGFNSGSITSSYWNSETNSIFGLSGIGAGSGVGAMGLTSTEMKTLSSFASWDIDDVGGTGKIWRIYAADSSPLLRSFLTPLNVTTVNDFVSTYDGTAKSGGNGYVADSAVASKIFYGGSAQGAKDVGSYDLHIYSNQNGYDLTGNRFSIGGLTITPAPLTVSANAASKTYDGAAFTGGNGVAYSGFVNSETATVLGGALSYSGTSQGATNAGHYAITPGGLTSTNYTLSFVDGALTINPAALTAIAGNLTGSVAKTYDGSALATLTVGNYLLSGWFGADSATITKTVGIYADQDVGSNKLVTVNLTNSDYAATGTTNLGNYTLPSFISGNVGNIAKAQLTLTANNASKTYGDANPALTSTLSGFVNGESILTSGVSGTSLTSTSATTSTGVGSVAIVSSVGTIAANNYYVSNLVNGTLTIDRRLVGVSADAKTKTYSDADPVLTYTVAADGVGRSRGLVVGDALSGQLSRTAGEAAGAYTIGQGTLSNVNNPNYQIAYVSAELTIGAAPVPLPPPVVPPVMEPPVVIPPIVAPVATPPNELLLAVIAAAQSSEQAATQTAISGRILSWGLAASPPNQVNASQDADGFLKVFVVDGGINLGDEEVKPNIAR